MKALHRTRDVYLASFLLAEDVELVSLKRLGPKTVELCFVADWRLHELLRFYRTNKPLSIVPLELFEAFQQIKSLSRTRQ